MKKKDDSKNGPKGQNADTSFLSEEDQKLWNKISGTTNPLDQKKRDRVSTAPEPTSKSLKNNKNKKHIIPKKLDHDKLASDKPTQNRRKTSPEITQIDRKKKRKIATDQIEIQATLDLHGYRQEQAHSSLKSFIKTAQARNFRYVLIITGKGSRKASPKDFWDEIEPGVLKRNVPIWLSEPDLKDYIVSYSTANPKHGGDGALYVQIRKAKNK